jgi:CHAD domain-containing protein
VYTDNKTIAMDLTDSDGATWFKGKAPVLVPATTAEEALAEIILGCVEHLRANEACVLARAHEEGVHQIRVATRRLRSCLSLFRDLIPKAQRKHLNRELRWLIGEFGPARDWDVFIGEVLGPVIGDLPDEPGVAVLRERAEGYRDKGYDRAQAALRSRRYAGLMMLVRAWAEGRSWHDGNTEEAMEKLQGPAVDVAHDLLEQHYRAVVGAGTDFDALNDEQRHQLRIEIKKMRYATEFFRSLYPKRQSATFVDALKTLQDDLGANNDLAVARELLAGLTKNEKGKRRAQAAYATGLVLGWHNHVSNDREQNLAKIWDDLIANRPFWDDAPDDSPASALHFVISEDAPGPAAKSQPAVKAEAKPAARRRTRTRAKPTTETETGARTEEAGKTGDSSD